MVKDRFRYFCFSIPEHPQLNRLVPISSSLNSYLHAKNKADPVFSFDFGILKTKEYPKFLKKNYLKSIFSHTLRPKIFRSYLPKQTASSKVLILV